MKEKKRGFLHKLSELFPQKSSMQSTGGLRRKLSPCCGASVIASGKGIIRDICSKCKKPIRENRLGN